MVQTTWFHVYDDSSEIEYTFNLAFVCDIDREVPDSWEVTTVTGVQYTLEDDNLSRFREALGL